MTNYKTIPTWNEGVWEETKFQNYRGLSENLFYLIFKEPGQNIILMIQPSSLMKKQLKFNKQGFYCDKPMRSKDFMKFIGKIKKTKCREGVIYKNKGNTWYLTRDYYMWLNFLTYL